MRIKSRAGKDNFKMRIVKSICTKNKSHNINKVKKDKGGRSLYKTK